MLTDDMVALIGRHSIGSVATIAADGSPTVSPKATFLVLDPRTIAFAHIRSPGTVANLADDPRVEVTFTDPFHRTGCRVKGRAAYAVRQKADALVLSKFEEHWPDLFPLVQGVVTIQCGDAAMLASPSYDVGAGADALADDWMRRFADDLGYEVRRC